MDVVRAASCLTARGMLSQHRGVWAAHCYFVETNDRVADGHGTTYGFDDTPHMAVWLPERRIFFVNPGVVVFTVEETRDIDLMVKKLFFEQGIYFAPEHNTTRVRLLTLDPTSTYMKQTNYLFKDHITFT